MLRTILGDDDVAWGRRLQGLRHFLKGALVIGDFAVTVFVRAQRADYLGFDEAARGFQAGVDV